MEKIKRFFTGEIGTALLALLLLGGAGYTGYSSYYVLPRMDNAGEIFLYGFLSAVFAGLAALLLSFTLKYTLIKKLILSLGCGIGMGALYLAAVLTIQKINAGSSIYETVAYIFLAVFTLGVGALLALVFLKKSKDMKKILNRIISAVLAVAVLGGSITLAVTGFTDKTFTFYDKEVAGFAPLTAEETKITEDDITDCEAWYNTNIANAGKNGIVPAYDFTVDGVSLKDTYTDWEYETEEKRTETAKEDTVTLTYKEKGLKATVTAICYLDKSTCDWSVEIENIGEKNSGIITDFYALNSDLAKSEVANLYYCRGSNATANDFTLFTKDMTEGERIFESTERATTEYLPYFNFVSDDTSFLLATGWTGNWKTSFVSQSDRVNVKVSQKELKTYLTPGEKLRSPEVSLTFYSGKALKGFNLFREYMKENVTPDNISQVIYQCAGGGTFDAQAALTEIKNSGVIDYIDCFWFDAEAWFYDDTKTTWSESVGNWTERTDIFPNGFEEVTAMLKKENLNTMLWFEPERLCKGTLFYDVATENGWLIDCGNNDFMWNLADDDACQYLCEYMVKFLTENGISEYRQDFNFSPSEYWQANDAENRVGITENHYIVNLYKYLDYLLTNVKGLKIDNCASGGRRLDLAMMHYSIPLWRSDYQCGDHEDNAESAQVQTYGLSLFLPYSNIGNPWEDNTYEYASDITSVKEVYHAFAVKNAEECKKFLEQYVGIRHYLLDNYYPLTGTATVKAKEWVAMQFGTETDGIVMAYRHKNAPKNLTVQLSGLLPDANYSFSYVLNEAKNTFTETGENLAKGLTITAEEAPEAVILEYNIVKA